MVSAGNQYASKISATRTNVYKVKGFGMPGTTISEYQGSFDGLGYANLTWAGAIMPEWRGNASVRYSLEDDAWGGSACEAWIRRDRLAADPQFRPLLERWEGMEKTYEELSARKDPNDEEKRTRDGPR